MMGWFKKEAQTVSSSSRPALSPQQRERPRAEKSPQPSQTSPAPVSMEGKAWRSVANDARTAAQESGKAVSLIQDMMQPSDRESPDRVQELLDKMGVLATAMHEIKQQQTAILLQLQRKTTG